MPRTRSLAWSELKIGVLTITAIVIAAVLVFSLTGGKGWFWQRYTLKTRFPNVAGLAAGSPVRVAGVQVGSVKDIEFAGEQVDVVFDVNKKVQRADHRQVDRVPRLGLAARRSSAVDITPSTTGTPIPECGYVPQGRAKGQFADIAEQAIGHHRRGHRPGARPAAGQGIGRQADHRRPALQRTAAVRRDRRPDDARASSRAAARSASCSRIRRRPTASRRRSRTSRT